MAVAFKAAGTVASGTAMTAVSVPYPAGFVAGDFAILLVQTCNSVGATPSGWTLTNSSGNGTAGTAAASGLVSYYRMLTGGDAAPSVASGSITGAFDAQIVTYTGVSPALSGSTVVVGSGASSTTVTYPTVTTTVANCAVLYFGSLTSSVTMTSRSPTVPAGTTQTLLGNFGIYGFTQAAPGTVGLKTSTISSAAANATSVWVLPPTVGAISGTTDLTFTPAATLSATGVLAGSSALTFTPNGSLSAIARGTGATSLTFTPAAAISSVQPISGTTSLTFTASATLRGFENAVGNGSITFNVPPATLTGNQGSVGATSLTFTPAGAITGQGALIGSSSLSFAPAATLTGAAPLSGATSLTLTPTGALSGGSMMVGTTSLTFTPAGTLTSRAPMVGATSLTLTAAGNLVGLVSSASLEFSRDGVNWYPYGVSPKTFALSPNDYVRITYTATAPTLTVIPR